MEVIQVANLVNLATSEAIGDSAVVLEDLSNVVDVGVAVFNANGVDNYVRSLVNHIGKVIFVNRRYNGNIPSILRDGWEYGSVLEKITMELPEATENESWELQDGEVYEQNLFTKPVVTAKFFNKKVTFEVPISITERQVKESFSNAAQLNAFVSMIYNAVDTSMTIKIDEMAMRLINNMITETLYSERGAGAISGWSGTKAVNLLYLYNQKFNKSITAADAVTDPEFIRYAAYVIGLYSDRLTKASTLFNVGGKVRYTPDDRKTTVLLSEFARAADVYLQSDTFHDEYTRLLKADKVAYWQGSGTSYDFQDTSRVFVKNSSDHTVSISGVIGVMFDRDALMMCNEDRRTTTHYNAKAEFYNNWYKWDMSLYSDTNENFVFFYVA